MKKLVFALLTLSFLFTQAPAAPSSDKVLADFAAEVAKDPGHVRVLLAAAFAAHPDQIAEFTAAAVKLIPADEVPALVLLAVQLSPSRAVQITRAAVTATPTLHDAIVAAVVVELPDQAAAVKGAGQAALRAVNNLPDGMPVVTPLDATTVSRSS